MKKTALYAFALLCLSCKNEIQPEVIPMQPPSEVLFEKTYPRNGNEYLYSALVENDSLILCGSFSDAAFTKSDMALTRLSKNGKMAYNYEMGLSGILNDAYRLIKNQDGTYLMLGGSGNTSRDGMAVFVNAQGQYQSQFSSGGTEDDHFSDAVRLSDGSYLFTGTTSSMGHGYRDMYLVKMKNNGTLEWERSFGTAGNDGITQIIPVTGGYWLYGYTDGAGAGDRDLLIMKINEQGDSLWSKTYGGPTYEQSGAIIASGDGNYMICGHSTSFGDPLHDALVIKVNEAGDVLWQKTYGSLQHEGADAIIRLSNGDFAMTAYSMMHGMLDDQLYYLQVDAAGGLKRQMRYGNGLMQRGTTLAEVSDGIMLIGYSVPPNNQNSELYVVKIKK